MLSPRTLSVVVLATFMVPTPGQAQVELAGFAGFLAPTTDFAVSVLPSQFGLSRGKQRTGLSYGGLARVWLEPHFGIEGSLSRTSSDMAVTPQFPTPQPTTIPAHITVGTVAALIRFPVGELNNPVWASVGAAWVGHGGPAYSPYSGTSPLGGSLGVGTEFHLMPHLGIDLGFRTLLYSMTLRDSAGTLPGHFQVDFHGWVGLVLQLGSRGPDDELSDYHITLSGRGASSGD